MKEMLQNLVPKICKLFHLPISFQFEFLKSFLLRVCFSSWDQQYITELKNFAEFGDIGQIWFGKKMMDTIVNWVATKIDKKASVLDLGCGNGILLIQLVFS